MAGMIKRFASAGADLLEEFYSKTPTERLRTASERATYDPEDGGLGLAPGNTSEERMQLMFPTRVFHGGGGRQARKEQLRHVPGMQVRMFASDNGQVASSYAPAGRIDRKPQTEGLSPDEVPSFVKMFYEEQKRNQDVPDFSGNVMPLRIDDSDAAVIDYEGRLFSGYRTDDTPDGVGILNDAMLTDAQGTPKLRFRRETGEFGKTDMSYLPHEKPPLDSYLSLLYPYSTDELHSMSGYAIARQYGNRPSMTRFDNIIDIGRHRHGETKRERYIPSTVFAIRDGSKVRSDFAAFDPLLRNYPGLSLGTSAAAVGSLLDQLPTDEEKQGALYAEGER